MGKISFVSNYTLTHTHTAERGHPCTFLVHTRYCSRGIQIKSTYGYEAHLSVKLNSAPPRLLCSVQQTRYGEQSGKEKCSGRIRASNRGSFFFSSRHASQMHCPHFFIPALFHRVAATHSITFTPACPHKGCYCLCGRRRWTACTLQCKTKRQMLLMCSQQISALPRLSLCRCVTPGRRMSPVHADVRAHTHHPTLSEQASYSQRKNQSLNGFSLANTVLSFFVTPVRLQRDAVLTCKDHTELRHTRAWKWFKCCLHFSWRWERRHTELIRPDHLLRQQWWYMLVCMCVRG